MVTCRKGGCDEMNVGATGYCLKHDPMERLRVKLDDDEIQRLRWSCLMPSWWNRRPRFPSKKEW